MSKKTTDSLLTALLSSAIFYLVLRSGLDFVFMFLSTLPLFLAGPSKSPEVSLKAGILATIFIALLTNSFFVSLLFLLVFALPSWYICRMSTHHYDIKINQSLPTLRLWYPIGVITINLAIYGSVLLAIITAIFATQDTNLPQQLSQIIQNEIENISKNYKIDIHLVAQDVSFMLCGFLVWLWCIMLLAHAWIASSTLIRMNMTKRPNIVITPFPMPHWLLTLMAIWALASLIGGESMRFLGKASLIILLLPYFFQGAAMLHNNVRNWRNRRFLLFFIYIFTVVLWWPAMIMAGAGVWHHIKILNKHLSSGGNSSKS
mgnify:CR=1 FL=1